MPRTVLITGLILLAVIFTGLLTANRTGDSAEERHYWRQKLASRRSGFLDQLHVYAKAGKFPINQWFPGKPTPIFVDGFETPCAVGYLMLRDGQKTMVETIRRENLTVRIMDVKEGPVLDWMVGSGFLQEELARIQPSYNWIDEGRPDIVEGERIATHLFKVEAELRAQTETSLDEAVERLIISRSTSRKRAKAAS